MINRALKELSIDILKVYIKLISPFLELTNNPLLHLKSQLCKLIAPKLSLQSIWTQKTFDRALKELSIGIIKHGIH